MKGSFKPYQNEHKLSEDTTNSSSSSGSGSGSSCVLIPRTQPLICVGCYVHYWASCAINKGGFLRLHFRRRRRHTFASL